MAISQPAGVPFQTGFEATIVFIGAYGEVDLGLVQNWDSKQKMKQLIARPLNSPPVPRFLPDGWDFSFTIIRSNVNLDALAALKETAFWAGAPIAAETLYAYITNSDGSQSVFQFTNCQTMLSDAGSFTVDKEVTQKVTGFA